MVTALERARETALATASRRALATAHIGQGME
jgi:hypothetical protein